MERSVIETSFQGETLIKWALSSNLWWREKKQLNVKIFAMLKAYQKHKDMEHNQDNEEIEGDVDVWEILFEKIIFKLVSMIDII